MSYSSYSRMPKILFNGEKFTSISCPMKLQKVDSSCTYSKKGTGRINCVTLKMLFSKFLILRIHLHEKILIKIFTTADFVDTSLWYIHTLFYQLFLNVMVIILFLLRVARSYLWIYMDSRLV